MAYTITDISNILKKVIAPRVQELLPSETIALNKIQVNSGVTPFGNNEFYVSLRTGRHSGVATLPEGAKLASGKAKWSQARVQAKYTFGTFNLSDQSIAASRSNKGAIVSLLSENERALREDLSRHLNRQMLGAGNKVVATANGAGTASTTLVVDHAPGTGVTEDRAGTKYLAEGMYISIGGGTAVQIASVDSDTQVTLAAADTWLDNETVVIASPDGTASDEMDGFQAAITNTGTFQNIARSGNPWWQSAPEATNEVLTVESVVKQVLKAQEFGKVDVGLTNLSLFNKFGELLTSMKRTSTPKEVLSGGWLGLEILPGVGLVLEFDVPGGEIQLWDFDSFTIGRLEELNWLDVGGGNVLRINDYAEWQGSLKHYGNLACKNVRANRRLTLKKIA